MEEDGPLLEMGFLTLLEGLGEASLARRMGFLFIRGGLLCRRRGVERTGIRRMGGIVISLLVGFLVDVILDESRLYTDHDFISGHGGLAHMDVILKLSEAIDIQCTAYQLIPYTRNALDTH